MDLLNRYLHAVRFWLPKAQQEDILAELGEDLRSQIEDREAELGHTLDEDGVAEFLKQRGHPMRVAGSYLPQRSLIGPVVFPAYQFILKLVIFWIQVPLFVFVVGPATVLSSRDASGALIKTVWTLLMAAVFAFGVITLIFAILERYPFEKSFPWNPRRLPRVPPVETASSSTPAVTRFTAITEVVSGLLAAFLWIDLMWYPKSLDINGIVFAPTPVWQSFFWPILLLTLARAAAGVVIWLRPCWMRTRLSVAIIADAAMLILFGALVNMGPWIQVAAPSLPAAGVANANHWANSGMSIGLSIASVITLIDTVREARHWMRVKPAGGHATLAVRR